MCRCVEKWWETDHAKFLASYEDEDTDRNERGVASNTSNKRFWNCTNPCGRSTPSSKHNKQLESPLPQEDLDIQLGWRNMLEFLSATNIDIDWPLLMLESMHKFGAGYLPTGGTQHYGLDENALEIGRRNRSKPVQAGRLHTPKRTLARACAFFGHVSRWWFARNNLPRMLDVLTHGNSLQKCLALTRSIVLEALPHTIAEVGQRLWQRCRWRRLLPCWVVVVVLGSRGCYWRTERDNNNCL